MEIINIAKEKYQIEGITLLGGEPFLQAEGLSKIAKYAQQLDLSVMVFSGYLLEELTENNNDNFSVTFINFFEDGPYIGMFEVILFLKTNDTQTDIRIIPIIKNSTGDISQVKEGLTADELEIFSQYMRAITINHKFRKKEKNS